MGCFGFILNLCNFLKMLRCQLIIGGQKSPFFCHNRMVDALHVFYCTFFHVILDVVMDVHM
jgi:hypothetical protein